MNKVKSEFRLFKGVKGTVRTTTEFHHFVETLHHENGRKERGQQFELDISVPQELAERICAALNSGDVVDRVTAKLSPQPGDTLVVKLREEDKPDHIADMARGFFNHLACNVLLLFPGQDIQHLDEEAMRRHGWVRAKTT